VTRGTRKSPAQPEAVEFRAGTLSLMVSRSGGQLFADVFVDGQDESLYTVRLDADENTATVYDPGSDEGNTVYERGTE